MEKNSKCQHIVGTQKPIFFGKVALKMVQRKKRLSLKSIRGKRKSKELGEKPIYQPAASWASI